MGPPINASPDLLSGFDSRPVHLNRLPLVDRAEVIADHGTMGDERITEKISDLTTISYVESTDWAMNMAKLGLWLEWQKQVAPCRRDELAGNEVPQKDWPIKP